MIHYPSFPYVPRFSMVILNELSARPSLTTVRLEHFVSSIAAAFCGVRCGDARIFVSPLGEALRVTASSEPSISEYLRIHTNNNEYTITLNGGSLGSWVDEERS